ncbi:MAG: cysteine synthase family protein [Bacilli bacterium]|nr:cysteine synthase family protein [Bacilli bacterium]
MNNLIGNTPMIKIKYKYNNKIKYIYVKLEQYNLTGSIKDRIAKYIIEEEKKKGLLKENMPIIEATSGNTGISFSALGTKLGHPVYIFMPNWVSKERIILIKLYNAKITLISKDEGGFKECIKRADNLAKKINGYRPNQFSNHLNTKCHYETTGKEIINQLKGTKIGGFISGIGSGGTLMGVSKKLKEYYPYIEIGAVEPIKMPLLTTKKIIGEHKIEGIGDDFIPDLVDRNTIDIVFDIDDNDAINMARLINKKLGVGVGISSGANFLGAVLLGDYLSSPVVTIFPDDNKKYLTTDLTKPINLKKEFISNKIELINYTIIYTKYKR